MRAMRLDQKPVKLYTREDAERIVYDLSIGELDGWTYTAEEYNDTQLYCITLRTKEREFIGRWTQ